MVMAQLLCFTLMFYQISLILSPRYKANIVHKRQKEERKGFFYMMY